MAVKSIHALDAVFVYNMFSYWVIYEDNIKYTKACMLLFISYITQNFRWKFIARHSDIKHVTYESLKKWRIYCSVKCVTIKGIHKLWLNSQCRRRFHHMIYGSFPRYLPCVMWRDSRAILHTWIKMKINMVWWNQRLISCELIISNGIYAATIYRLTCV